MGAGGGLREGRRGAVGGLEVWAWGLPRVPVYSVAFTRAPLRTRSISHCYAKSNLMRIAAHCRRQRYCLPSAILPAAAHVKNSVACREGVMHVPRRSDCSCGQAAGLLLTTAQHMPNTYNAPTNSTYLGHMLPQCCQAGRERTAFQGNIPFTTANIRGQA